MTAATHPTAPAGAPAPALRGLIGSEVLRARSRRSLRWLAALALLSVLGVAAISWATSGYVTGADLDAATTQFVTDQQAAYESCMADPTLNAAERDNACWQPTDADATSSAPWYLPHQPFDQAGVEGLVSFAGGVGLLVALLLAASAGGADWGARTMGLLLSWEPRRTRVFLVRLAIAVLIAVAIEAVLVLVAAALGGLIAGAHGVDPDVGTRLADTYRPLDAAATRELALRWLPLTALAVVGSFGVAMLTRSTGWAIGATIGFVAIVETALQLVWPWGAQWLVQTNVLAWLQGGTLHQVTRQLPVSYSGDGSPPGQVLITDTRALLTLTLITLTTAALGWIALRRRDVE